MKRRIPAHKIAVEILGGVATQNHRSLSLLAIRLLRYLEQKPDFMLCLRNFPVYFMMLGNRSSTLSHSHPSILTLLQLPPL